MALRDEGGDAVEGLAVGDDLHGTTDFGCLAVDVHFCFVAQEVVGLENVALHEAKDDTDDWCACFVSDGGREESLDRDPLVDHDAELFGEGEELVEGLRVFHCLNC